MDMNRDQAEAALQAWAAAERNDLVRAAYRAGVPKNRISTLTGISRTTIDKILETPMKATSSDLARYLTAFTQAWPRQPASWDMNYWNPPAPLATQHTVRNVADWLFADAEFKALKLGNWLTTPDGQFFVEAVSMITPAPYAKDIDLLIEALQLAAKLQQEDARGKIALAVFGVGAAAMILGAGRTPASLR
jgi:hypothetical protein